MDDILDYAADIIRARVEWPVFMGMAAGAPDDAVIINQRDAPPPFITFGGVYYTYGIKVSARSKGAKAARAIAGKAECALLRSPCDEREIMPASSIMYAGQDERQRHVYMANYRISEMREF
jgi:hypothetical protein